MCGCIHCASAIVFFTEMIRSSPETRFLCIGTGTASAIVVAQSLSMGRAQFDTVTTGSTSSTTTDTLHQIATVVAYAIICHSGGHCSEAVASLGHVTLGASVEVFRAITLEV